MELIIQNPGCLFLVALDLNPIDAEQALQTLATTLLRYDCVKTSFIKAVLDRERQYPTGIRMDGEIHIALAHTDPEHVKKNAILLGRFNQPVLFQEMINPVKVIPVKLVFMIAAVDPILIQTYIERLVERVFLNPNAISFLASANKFEDLKLFVENNLLPTNR